MTQKKKVESESGGEVVMPFPAAMQADLHAFEAYLIHERQLSDYTLRNYRHAIEHFFGFYACDLGGDLKAWGPLSPRSISAYVIEAQQTISRRTLHMHMSALRTFYKFLRKQAKVESNPFLSIPLPKQNKPLPKFMTESQMALLLDMPGRLLENESIEAKAALRDQLILELLYGAGLRISELCSLTQRQIDFSTGVIRIVGKGNKERLCPMGVVALACCRDYLKRMPALAEDLPFLLNDQARAIYPRWVQKRLKYYLGLAGLPMDMTPHKIRHSFATHMVNGGADLRLVQELLGHASLSTTQIYTHVSMSRLKSVFDHAHPRA